MRFRKSCEVDDYARDGGRMTGWRYRRAVMTLRAGGIVAYPTESVYGLGCDPWDRAAVARVFAVKRRPVRKRCIVIAADTSQLRRLVDIHALQFATFASRYWPGPVTLVAPARDGAPAWLVDTDGTLATRVTNHPVACGLCASFRRPLISTSANRATRPPARDSLRVRAAFGTEIDWYVPGRVGGLDTPTRIIDIRDGRMIRS